MAAALSEPAVDLALVAALVSSERQVALPAQSCFSRGRADGEVRGANLATERVKEAIKLGCQTDLSAGVERTLRHSSEFKNAAAQFTLFAKWPRSTPVWPTRPDPRKRAAPAWSKLPRPTT